MMKRSDDEGLTWKKPINFQTGMSAQLEVNLSNFPIAPYFADLAWKIQDGTYKLKALFRTVTGAKANP
jgi:hypothetical protein